MEIRDKENGVRLLSTQEEEDAVLNIIQPIIAPYGLQAALLPQNIMSKGVQGDESTYTRVILLSGPHPDFETLSDISTKISNIAPINHVVFELATSTT